MATSTIKGGFYTASGTKSIPAGGNITNLATVTLGKGIWLISTYVKGLAGTYSSNSYIQNRINEDSVIRLPIDNGVGVTNQTVYYVDSTKEIRFNTFSNTAMNCSWNITAVNLA